MVNALTFVSLHFHCFISNTLSYMMTHQDFMQRAIALAVENVRQGAAPLVPSLYATERYWQKA